MTDTCEILVQGQRIRCDRGANLRQTLIRAGIPVHNGAAQAINCRGLGTCGTCAVRIEGEVSPMGWRERGRLSVPPHQLASDRRLACQVTVQGNLRVSKDQGFWGHHGAIAWTADHPPTTSL